MLALTFLTTKSEPCHEAAPRAVRTPADRRPRPGAGSRNRRRGGPGARAGDGLGVLELLRRQDRPQRHQGPGGRTGVLRSAGRRYTYVNIDEGWWQGTRDSAGNITVDTAEWPGGMAAIADYLHSKGLKAGIYTDAGRDGCGYYFPTGRPAAPGTGAKATTCRTCCSSQRWGFDFVKVDCAAATPRASTRRAPTAPSATPTAPRPRRPAARSSSRSATGARRTRGTGAPGWPRCGGPARTSSTTARRRRCRRR